MNHHSTSNVVFASTSEAYGDAEAVPTPESYWGKVIGNAQELTILELAKKIKEQTKCKSDLIFHPLPKDDAKRRCPDTGKLEKLVGWKPKIEFEDGLRRTIKWFSQEAALTDKS